MAVSKRLRFEILRRDNHTCRYCGAKGPDVSMRVDHVVPVALGGSDDPTNLVAACEPCNTGKSSASPDAAIVAEVSESVLRFAAAMRQAAEEMALYDNTAVYEAVVKAWTSFRRNQIPGDYRETIDQFLAAGLPADDIVQMAHVADAKPSIYNRWSYFCGCCWTRVRQLQERALEIVDQGQSINASAATTTLATEWSFQDLRDAWLAAVELSESCEVVPSVSCGHPDGEDYGHCGDPVCMVIATVELKSQAIDNLAYEHKQRLIAERINAAAEEDVDA